MQSPRRDSNSRPPQYKAGQPNTWLRLPAVKVLSCPEDISQSYIKVVVSSEMWENNSEGWGRNMCTVTGVSPWKHSWSRNMVHLLSELKPDLATKLGALLSPKTLDTHQSVWCSGDAVYLFPKLPGLNLGRTPAIVADFCQSPQANTGTAHRLGHYRFFHIITSNPGVDATQCGVQGGKTDFTLTQRFITQKTAVHRLITEVRLCF
jgi:hypothetical protein